MAGLSVTALGVVYGDIGTSPLYALRACFSSRGVPPSPENVLGVLSLIFWSLNFVVSLKYLVSVMRADNRGEGGILALLALLGPIEERSRVGWLLASLGLFGAAMLYGDGVMTPAISVLGAVEGLRVAAPELPGWVVPIIGALILTALFLFQRRGTGGVGAIFGPLMIVWFVVIALLGLRGIVQHPRVLLALNPWHAVEFFLRDGLPGFLILGTVVLVVTGGEALYADMGHFGRRPIRLAWFAVALPSLVLNYFGQGALLVADASAAGNPFYALAPAWGLYPLLVIATAAAVVASQALISGAFSMTRQAVQLGYSPRVTIVHTSSTEAGQIYIPEVNWALLVSCVLVVLGFGSADRMASAYGIAVTGTMTITTVLFCAVARDRWHWSWWRVGVVGALFLFVDLAFFGANLVKILDGGWFPVLVAAGAFLAMSTWKRGRRRLAEIMRQNTLPMDLFLDDVAKGKPYRVPGTAVFMTSVPGGASPVLLHHLKHNKVLHQRVLMMSVLPEQIPQVDETDRLRLRELAEGFYEVTARYGFMETPDVPAALSALESKGLIVRPMETTFYLGRETLIPTRSEPAGASHPPGARRLPLWRRKLFAVMARNAPSATAFFNLPPNRVVELGAQIQF